MMKTLANDGVRHSKFLSMVLPMTEALATYDCTGTHSCLCISLLAGLHASSWRADPVDRGLLNR
jgi:hypothetical protein